MIILVVLATGMIILMPQTNPCLLGSVVIRPHLHPFMLQLKSELARNVGPCLGHAYPHAHAQAQAGDGSNQRMRQDLTNNTKHPTNTNKFLINKWAPA